VLEETVKQEANVVIFEKEKKGGKPVK